MTKHRNYFITINNWSQEEYDLLWSEVTKYSIIAKEVGDECGTPHLHATLCYKNEVSWDNQKKKFPRANIRPCNDVKDSIAYCKKLKDWEEKGTAPKGQGKRSDLDEVRSQVRNGSNMRDIISVASNYQSLRSAELLYKYIEQPRRWKTRVIWIYGPTGTGKTHYAKELLKHSGYPDYYEAMDTGRWFEKYDAHEGVLIDDMREDFMRYSAMLKFLDENGFTVEVKGGSRQFLAKMVVITCPFHPQVLYTNIGEDIKQLLRRIEAIYYIDYGFEKPELDMVHQKLLQDFAKNQWWNKAPAL